MIDQLPQRLSSKIRVLDDGCWEWLGAINHQGYGIAHIGSLPTTTPGRCGPAHKVVYEAIVGLVPVGMQLDHSCHTPDTCVPGVSCRHRRCVNLGHLSPATAQENTLRGGTLPALNVLKEECPDGHAYDQDNTYVNPRRQRNCRQCQRDRRAARTPEQIRADRAKGRERAAKSRAENPELHRERVRASRQRATA